ncbi:transglycosylase domain-containing protein [Metapseudomonas furukawaii]|uniref:peptidoglycan glycosyltransferase n=1 Tax=Metapseudomonas furukawaii TaxID=1149133 RepID=A0AAD1C125_METFU|nr:transglycosylase domain-containing protein [Pseudomonas furukawaii]ELS24575.1 Membrane carboxypeptidase (penicillin-binding protein) [Pseudomonas furukawaii]BAU74822.1 membrane carboxypeptidase [Pseudomonas furukawaii]
MGAIWRSDEIRKEVPQGHLNDPAVPPKKPRRRHRLLFWGLSLTALVLVGLLVSHEVRTSRFQAHELSRYAASLNYRLEEGPSDAIRYPGYGPFDLRLGYAYLPQMLDRLEKRGYSILQQTRFSPALISYTDHGLFPPYQEKVQAGISICDCRGRPFYQFRYPQQRYPDFTSIPPVLVSSLLFIENRKLLDSQTPLANPAVDWPRFSKAALTQVGKAIDLDGQSAGGSTLATQLEKYRHSPYGRTISASEKIRQMVSASVRAYRDGPQTLDARQRIVMDYLNSVPLSAAPGHGEVHGIADGLRVWYGADFNQVNRLLADTDGDPAARGLAMRQVLSLFIAQRRPSYYLSRAHEELNALTDSHIRVLAGAGVIDPTLRDAALGARLRFRNWEEDSAIQAVDANKGISVSRSRLSSLLRMPLYDLDRLDLTANSTLHSDLQNAVTDYLKHLADPTFAEQVGLYGERLLSPEKTADVRYSFTLFERTPSGNRVRVQTDNTDQPFDINEGSKLELGSTAKLRVLATYLEYIATLHRRYAGLGVEELRKVPVDPLDAISRWSIDYLIEHKDRDLYAMLQAAMERTYSASPYESFFTGGGVHTFNNFRKEDNGRRPTLRDSLRESINLPFVRLLRDIVRHDMYRPEGGKMQLLSDDKDPRRQGYLDLFVSRESQTYLRRFWNKYQGKSADERMSTFLDGLNPWGARMAAIHRYLLPQADLTTFAAFMRERVPKANPALTDKRVQDLYTRYGPGAFNLNDQGYVARVHPLELWLLGYLQANPQATFRDAVEASGDERREVYSWLFKSKRKHARDKRIRIMLEVEAFLDIHEHWKSLGYPFDHLVPSLATALGSSGDRPAALAELMGIILNDGVRQSTLRIDQLHFAADTPYETLVGYETREGKRVMTSEVAATLRDSLSKVVEGGTARRLQGTFTLPGGEPLVMGGKTGTGDNRIQTVTRYGAVTSSKAMNRTATFVFYLGPRHFGTLTAFVEGSKADKFSFTSALPVQVLKGMAPILQPYLAPGLSTQCQDLAPAVQVSRR